MCQSRRRKPIATYPIPFDAKTGNLLSYEDSWRDVRWVDNYVFTDTLTYAGFGRGRSAVTIYWVDSIGRKYPMFIKDFDTLMRAGKVVGTTATGRWTFTKRGQNYGVRFLDDSTLETEV